MKGVWRNDGNSELMEFLAGEHPQVWQTSLKPLSPRRVRVVERERGGDPESPGVIVYLK